jgi:hypothetical protein
MRTPAGNECSFFYGDYHRGRNLEECRLLKVADEKWTSNLCLTCPVPGIQMANACKFLELRGKVIRPITAAFQRRVQVTAYCVKTERAVQEPHIGCGECHILPFSFEVKD